MSATKLDTVGKAIFETIFEEKWDALHPKGIERAIYRDAARAAIVAALHWDAANAASHNTLNQDPLP